MNPSYRKIVIVLVLLVVIYTILRVLGIIAFYRTPSAAMEPNFTMGQLIFASNLVSPKRGDVVCYRSKSVEIIGHRPAEAGEFIGRIVGIGKEELEIREGYVYINGQIEDTSTVLKFSYMIGSDLIDLNKDFLNQLSYQDAMPAGDSLMLNLDDQQKKTFVGKERLKKTSIKFGDIQSSVVIPASIQSDWTMNDYGPITIPENHFFILGDNRNNSEDSRVRGCIPATDIVSTVLN